MYEVYLAPIFRAKIPVNLRYCTKLRALEIVLFQKCFTSVVPTFALHSVPHVLVLRWQLLSD